MKSAKQSILLISSLARALKLLVVLLSLALLIVASFILILESLILLFSYFSVKNLL